MKIIVGLILLFTVSTFGMTIYEKTIDCPICDTIYTERVQGSGSTFGQRLDLKPWGATAVPWIIPRCPKCSFVQYQDSVPDSIATVLKPFINSDFYSAMIKDGASTYYLLANIFEHLQYKNSVIAYKYMQASWEVERKRKKYVAYLDKVLEHLMLGAQDETDTAFSDYHSFLIGEFLRQTNEFDKAKVFFDSLEQVSVYQKFPYNQLIPFEKKLIRKRKYKPVNPPKMEKTEEDIREEPAYKMMEQSPDLSLFLTDYTIEDIRAKYGFTAGVDFDQGMQQWAGDFIPKERLKFSVMGELIFPIDTLDSLIVDLTPEKLTEVFSELCSSQLINKLLTSTDRIRVRAAQNRLHWDSDIGTVLHEHMKDILPPSVKQEDWIYIILDIGNHKMQSLYHPLNTDIYVTSRFISSEPLELLISQNLMLNKPRDKYFIIVTDSLSVSAIEKQQSIIDSVPYYFGP